MHNSKLLNLWRCFSTKQIKRLGDFIHSPFFNKQEELILLFDYLKKYAPAFKRKKALDKELVFAAVFPNTPYNAKQLSYHMSNLVKLSERFIIICHLEKDEIAQNSYLIKQYNDWNLEKKHINTLKELSRLLTQMPYRHAEYYYEQYCLAELATFSFTRQHKRQHSEGVQEAIDNLDVFYLSKKLSYTCEMMNRQSMTTGTYEVLFLQEILQHLANNSYEEHPCITIYHKILMMLQDSDSEIHFNQLKNLLNEFAHLFPAIEARTLYTYAINYTIKKINQGATHYQWQLFQLYLEVLNKKIIFDNGQLSPWTYKNIISIALRLKEYDWTANFINDYKEYLEPSVQENAVTYNMAYLKFYQQQYDDALVLLQQVEFSDVYYSLDSRALLSKIYYELNETDLLYSHIHAFKAYLRRNKFISEYVKEIYFNLIEFMRQLEKIDEQSKDKLYELQQTIENTKKIADLAWLRQKVQDKISLYLKNNWSNRA